MSAFDVVSETLAWILSIDVDDTKLKKSLSGVKTQLTNIEKKIKKTFDSVDESLDKFGEKFNKAFSGISVVDNFTSSIDHLSNAVKHSLDTFKDFSKSLESTKRALSKSKESLDDFDKGVKNASESTLDFKDKLEIAMAGIYEINNIASSAFNVLSASIKQSVLSFSSFEESMNMLRAVTGSSQEELDGIKQTFIDVGQESKFSSKDMADLGVELGRAGVSLSDISKSLKAFDEAANASGEPLQDVGYAVSTALNVMGDGFENAQRYADNFVAVANASRASVLGLARGVSESGDTLRRYGVSVESITKELGILSEAGFKSGRGATSLRSILSKFEKTTKETEAGLKGLNFNFAETLTRTKDLRSTFEELRVKLDGMNDAERRRLEQAIAGTEQITAFRALLRPTAKTVDALTEAIEKQTGASKKQADIMRQGLGFSLESLAESFNTLKISIGESLAPAIQLLANGLRGINSFLTDLPKPVKDFVAALLLISAAGAGIVTAISSVILVLGGLAGSLLTINASLAAFPALASYVGVAMMTLSSVTTAAFAAIGTAISGAAAPLAILGVAIGAAIIAYQTNFMGFADFIDSFVNGAIKSFSVWGDWLGTFFNDLSLKWKATFDLLSEYVGEKIEVIKGLFGSLSGFIPQLVLDAIIPAKKSIDLFVDSIKTAIDFIRKLKGSSEEELNQSQATIQEEQIKLQAIKNKTISNAAKVERENNKELQEKIRLNKEINKNYGTNYAAQIKEMKTLKELSDLRKKLNEQASVAPSQQERTMLGNAINLIDEKTKQLEKELGLHKDISKENKEIARQDKQLHNEALERLKKEVALFESAEKAKTRIVNKEVGNRKTTFKTEAELMKFVYPTNIGLGRGGLGVRGATAHGYEARDVLVGQGSPVKAAAPGKVTFAGLAGGYGNLVILDHGNGIQTVYAHNSKFQKKVGDFVKAGENIALSGGAHRSVGAGRSSGPHGHFEIRKGGQKVNIARNMGALSGGLVESNSDLEASETRLLEFYKKRQSAFEKGSKEYIFLQEKIDSMLDKSGDRQKKQLEDLEKARDSVRKSIEQIEGSSLKEIAAMRDDLLTLTLDGFEEEKKANAEALDDMALAEEQYNARVKALAIETLKERLSLLDQLQTEIAGINKTTEEQQLRQTVDMISKIENEIQNFNDRIINRPTENTNNQDSLGSDTEKILEDLKEHNHEHEKTEDHLHEHVELVKEIQFATDNLTEEQKKQWSTGQSILEVEEDLSSTLADRDQILSGQANTYEVIKNEIKESSTEQQKGTYFAEQALKADQAILILLQEKKRRLEEIIVINQKQNSLAVELATLQTGFAEIDRLVSSGQANRLTQSEMLVKLKEKELELQRQQNQLEFKKAIIEGKSIEQMTGIINNAQKALNIENERQKASESTYENLRLEIEARRNLPDDGYFKGKGKLGLAESDRELLKLEQERLQQIIEQNGSLSEQESLKSRIASLQARIEYSGGSFTKYLQDQFGLTQKTSELMGTQLFDGIQNLSEGLGLSSESAQVFYKSFEYAVEPIGKVVSSISSAVSKTSELNDVTKDALGVFTSSGQAVFNFFSGDIKGAISGATDALMGLFKLSADFFGGEYEKRFKQAVQGNRESIAKQRADIEKARNELMVSQGKMTKEEALSSNLLYDERAIDSQIESLKEKLRGSLAGDFLKSDEAQFIGAIDSSEMATQIQSQLDDVFKKLESGQPVDKNLFNILLRFSDKTSEETKSKARDAMTLIEDQLLPLESLILSKKKLNQDYLENFTKTIDDEKKQESELTESQKLEIEARAELQKKLMDEKIKLHDRELELTRERLLFDIQAGKDHVDARKKVNDEIGKYDYELYKESFNLELQSINEVYDKKRHDKELEYREFEQTEESKELLRKEIQFLELERLNELRSAKQKMDEEELQRIDSIRSKRFKTFEAAFKLNQAATIAREEAFIKNNEMIIESLKIKVEKLQADLQAIEEKLQADLEQFELDDRSMFAQLQKSVDLQAELRKGIEYLANEDIVGGDVLDRSSLESQVRGARELLDLQERQLKARKNFDEITEEQYQNELKGIFGRRTVVLTSLLDKARSEGDFKEEVELQEEISETFQKYKQAEIEIIKKQAEETRKSKEKEIRAEEKEIRIFEEINKKKRDEIDKLNEAFNKQFSEFEKQILGANDLQDQFIQKQIDTGANWQTVANSIINDFERMKKALEEPVNVDILGAQTLSSSFFGAMPGQTFSSNNYSGVTMTGSQKSVVTENPGQNLSIHRVIDGLGNLLATFESTKEMDVNSSNPYVIPKNTSHGLRWFRMSSEQDPYFSQLASLPGFKDGAILPESNMFGKDRILGRFSPGEAIIPDFQTKLDSSMLDAFRSVIGSPQTNHIMNGGSTINNMQFNISRDVDLNKLEDVIRRVNKDESKMAFKRFGRQALGSAN